MSNKTRINIVFLFGKPIFYKEVLINFFDSRSEYANNVELAMQEILNRNLN